MFDDKLRNDLRRETELFIETVVREDRSLLEFLTGKYTFVNERLARFYGLDKAADVKGDEFQQVSLEGTPRIGVLTQGSILSITSNPTRTSPVKRGKWILENILGTPPPPAPPNVPDFEVAMKAAPNASLREQLELHRKDPGCASCHKVMDPLGLGFENFDAIGRWRERDGKSAVDASGTLPTGETFNGSLELVEILSRRKENFARNVTQKLLTFALGRGLEYYDKCAVDKIMAALERNNYRFSTLAAEIAKSDPFLLRRGEGAKP
jgi:hypothetical protein